MQIVGYETAATGDADHAVLVLAEPDDVDRVALRPGTSLEFGLDERHCAGTFGDRGHERCGESAAPYCDRHVSRWACARCTGECTLPLDACREEHAVYLAAFAPATFKVGVTRAWRLETRLREQGADRAAHLRTVADGRIARQIETDLAADIGDSVRVPTKIDGLHRTVEQDAWNALIADFDVIDTVAFEDGLSLAERPMAETMAAGTVIGTKGRVLVLERAGSRYAVDLRDLIGYEVTEGRPATRLQSNLAAFD